MTTISPGTDTVGAQSGVRIDAYRGFMQSFIDGDLESAVKFAADDAEIIEPCSLPWGDVYHGVDGFRNLCLNIGSQFAESRLVVDHLIEFGSDGLIVIAQLKGIAQGTRAEVSEYYHEVIYFRGPDPTRFTFARVNFNDDVRLIRAFGYDTFPDLTTPVPFPSQGK